MSIILGMASDGRHFTMMQGAASGTQIVTEVGVVVDGPPEPSVQVESVELAIAVEATELTVVVEPLNV